MNSPVDLLLLGAFGPEVAPFERELGPSLSGVTSGLTVVARPIGVGPVAAAVGACTAVAEHRPRAVLFVGTCGAFRSSPFRIGNVVVPSFVRFIDGATSEGRAAAPAPMPTTVACHLPLVAGLGGDETRAIGVASTPAITTESDLAMSLARASACAVEHLEAFGVAHACQVVRVPFACALAVANFVDAGGRGEWLANHAESSQRVHAHVVRWLERGAEGIPRN